MLTLNLDIVIWSSVEKLKFKIKVNHIRSRNTVISRRYKRHYSIYSDLMFFSKKNSSIYQYFNLGMCIGLLYGFNERRNKRINHSQKEADNLFLSGS